MEYAVIFFAGAILCNCIPDPGPGLQGMPFSTPFEKPRGIGNSSPLLNVLWGVFNLCVGLYLLSRQPVSKSLLGSWRIVSSALGSGNQQRKLCDGTHRTRCQRLSC
jgi:hypothetical protein